MFSSKHFNISLIIIIIIIDISCVSNLAIIIIGVLLFLLVMHAKNKLFGRKGHLLLFGMGHNFIYIKHWKLNGKWGIKNRIDGTSKTYPLIIYIHITYIVLHIFITGQKIYVRIIILYSKCQILESMIISTNYSVIVSAPLQRLEQCTNSALTEH